MKLLAVTILSLFCQFALAGENQTIAKYFDCIGSTNFINNNLPVFSKVYGQEKKTLSKASTFTQGVDLSVRTDISGNIELISIGPELQFYVEEVEAGLQFGIANISAHTIQLINFRPNVGGVLEFGFLKNFLAKKLDTDPAPSRSLSEYYTSMYGENWGSYKLYLTKDHLTNKWKIQDSGLNTITGIFGILSMKNGVLVEGISEMMATKDVNSILSKKDGRIISVKGQKNVFKCEI